MTGGASTFCGGYMSGGRNRIDVGSSYMDSNGSDGFAVRLGESPNHFLSTSEASMITPDSVNPESERRPPSALTAYETASNKIARQKTPMEMKSEYAIAEI